MAPTNSRGREVERERDRPGKPISHRAMLSRALHRANMAVNLDNAQNFEAARLSYADACNLLHQVVQRTSGDDEKRKLEAIRSTYTNRIDELDQIAPSQIHSSRGKALPARPDSGDNHEDADLKQPQSDDDVLEESCDTQAMVTRSPDVNGNIGSYVAITSGHTTPNFRSNTTSDLPRPDHDHTLRAQTTPQQPPSLWDSTPGLRGGMGGGGIATVPAKQQSDHRQHQQQYMPPPLSPRREQLDSPGRLPGPSLSEAPHVRSNFSVPSTRSPANMIPIGGFGHLRGGSNESASWPDPSDEIYGSGGSIHSRSSSIRIRRKHIRVPSGIEAEFDAALDAAVEAAYDDSFDLAESVDVHFDLEAGESDVEVLASLREARLAKEQLREAEEADSFHQHPSQFHHTHERPGHEAGPEPFCQDFYDDNSSDDGDRLSVEIVRDIFTEGLARVHENNTPPAEILAQQEPAEHPPDGKPLSTNDLPNPQINVLGFSTSSCDTTVLSRRRSGPHAKQLKIETSAKFGTPNQIFFAAEGDDIPPAFKTSSTGAQQEDALRAVPTSGAAMVSPRSISPGPKLTPSETRHPNSPGDGTFISRHDPGSPLARRPSLHKNYSSSSLRSIKGRKMSLSNLDDSDLSPGTPSSTPFSGAAGNRLPALPSLPTPIMAAFNHHVGGDIGGSGNRVGNGAVGGMYLFDDNLHSPGVPGSPNTSVPGCPVALEACPTEFTFRPFWLMRCIYQTLAHPRGGYISTRLFIPRDVWKVKGVKLKNVEDKIASCDLLTAALLKLSRVDNNDADAVLEEMQALEAVLDQVQVNLVRRLGNEVGPQASGFMSSAGPETEPPGNMPRSSSVSSKSSSFSWKRLRSKNSAAGLGPASTGGPRPLGPDAVVDMLAPASLPMTPNPTRRPPKRDFHQVQFTGPNASYMTSLAQLFDAVQAIDQIARQVDDPGLRHADKTQVGLELSTRRAAEFFGFYICRFVLADVAILLDKFIKRGSEWVLV